jgi:hypothetical protein
MLLKAPNGGAQNFQLPYLEKRDRQEKKCKTQFELMQMNMRSETRNQ